MGQSPRMKLLSKQLVFIYFIYYFLKFCFFLYLNSRNKDTFPTGVEWSLDGDASNATVLVASEAHAITLAVEGLLGVVFTVATLTDEAVDLGEVSWFSFYRSDILHTTVYFVEMLYEMG